MAPPELHRISAVRTDFRTLLASIIRAADLRREFPGVAGWLARNLKYMRAFAAVWLDRDFVQGVLAQMPWWYQIALIEKVGDDGTRCWYAQAAIQHGWSRNVLVHQIESHLHLRQGRAATNLGSE
jgi:predicted nuclease of restriction endonuclease-like (RecB) superfamily